MDVSRGKGSLDCDCDSRLCDYVFCSKVDLCTCQLFDFNGAIDLLDCLVPDFFTV